MNQKLIQSLEFNEIKDRLPKLEEDYAKKLWQCVSPNITFFSEMSNWLKICRESLQFEVSDEDKEFLLEAAKLLPENTKDENCWGEWIEQIKGSSDRKGKQLFMPLRIAITGQSHGPELKYLINLIDRDLILERLGVS